MLIQLTYLELPLDYMVQCVVTLLDALNITLMDMLRVLLATQDFILILLQHNALLAIFQVVYHAQALDNALHVNLCGI